MEHQYTTTRVICSQIAKMADFAEIHPELIDIHRPPNFTPQREQELWERLADSLNGERWNGGCVQTTENWKAWWKGYASRLRMQTGYRRNLKLSSAMQFRTKVLATSDSRLLKVMGRAYVQKKFQVAGQRTEEDLGIRITSCFTLNKAPKGPYMKPKLVPFLRRHRISKADAKKASDFFLKTNKNTQTKTTITPVEQKSASNGNHSTPTSPERSINLPTCNAFPPNVSTAEAVLSIANEMNFESTLAKQKMELQREILQLHKRKAAAFQSISKKLCLL